MVTTQIDTHMNALLLLIILFIFFLGNKIHFSVSSCLQKQQENDILMCLFLFPIMINSLGIRDLRREERIKLAIEIVGFWYVSALSG